jgi:integrase
MWRLRVSYQGKQVTYCEFPTEELAMQAQGRWMQTGRLPEDDPDVPDFIVQSTPPPQHDPDEPRCGVLFDRWQEAKRARARLTMTGGRSYLRKQRKPRGGADTTEDRERDRFRRWAPAISDKLPSGLTEHIFEDRFKVLESSLAPKTLANDVTMLKTFLNWLVQNGHCDDNPIADWVVDADPITDRKRPAVVPDFTFIDILSDVFGTHDFRASAKNRSGYVGVSFQQSTNRWIAYDKRTYLGLFGSPEEAYEAVKAARGLNGETTDRLIFELLLGTAGRAAEVTGFRMMDVDLTAKKVWSRETVPMVDGKLKPKPVPKSGRPRYVRISPDLARLIQVERARRGTIDPMARLVTGVDGDDLNFHSWIRHRLVPALEVAIGRWAPLEIKRLMETENLTLEQAEERVGEQAELLRQLRPHDLRHTAVALMIAAGASEAEIQLTLGHSNIELSRRIYMHVLESSEASTAAKVQQLRRELSLRVVS